MNPFIWNSKNEILLNKRVIIIEDDEDTVRIFSELLEENEIDVVGHAYTGKDALQVYQEKKPDVVFVDIMMPDGNGFYAIKKIREKDVNVKIIAVTADMTSDTEIKLEELSIPLVYKPFDIKKILQLIND